MQTEQEHRQPQPARAFRPVPVRFLLPNLITLLALCSGVTAIRLAVEGRYQVAVAAVILACVLDAIDGRLARLLKGTSRFGAELDSLADFVNFGVAPAILIYVWSLNAMRPAGWIVALMLSMACALRLARFNVALEDPNKPAFAHGYFTGIPAPAGAGLAMAPMYLGFLDVVPDGHTIAKPVAVYIVAIAVLMVSRVPTFSGKSVTQVPREMVLPVLAAGALVIVCLITFPWETLVIAALIYVALLPVGAASYYRQKRKLQAASEAAGEGNTEA
ncbi:MAG: phosphatidylcholine/phosphatidylserine synthase [Rhizobiales bacterium]|nr:phosphatidylcholine/phosphatidylserine synthase [Hyphomicrobiales bacterium]